MNVVIAQQYLPFTLRTGGMLSDNFKPWGFWQVAQYKSWQEKLSIGILIGRPKQRPQGGVSMLRLKVAQSSAEQEEGGAGNGTILVFAP